MGKKVKKEGMINIFAGEHITRSPLENFLFEIIEDIYRKMKDHDFKEEYSPPQMLLMILSNVFSNILYTLIKPEDTTIRIDIFREMNQELLLLNERLFFSLEAAFAKNDVKN